MRVIVIRGNLAKMYIPIISDTKNANKEKYAKNCTDTFILILSLKPLNDCSYENTIILFLNNE